MPTSKRRGGERSWGEQSVGNRSQGGGRQLTRIKGLSGSTPSTGLNVPGTVRERVTEKRQTQETFS